MKNKSQLRKGFVVFFVHGLLKMAGKTGGKFAVDVNQQRVCSAA